MQKFLNADLICKLLGCYETELPCILDIYACCFHAEGGGWGEREEEEEREGEKGKERRGGRERERPTDRGWKIERERKPKGVRHVPVGSSALCVVSLGSFSNKNMSSFLQSLTLEYRKVW